MKLEADLKTALNENRLLILGTQVLFGFQFNGIFQEQFEHLPLLARALQCSGLTLLMLSVAFLIAPSMEHRLVERGQVTPRVLAVATFFAGWALLPLSVALAFDMYVGMEVMIGPTAGVVAGCLFFAAALTFWYVLAFVLKKKETKMSEKPPPARTSLSTQVDQLLTEARLIIPGAQALLGFQLTVSFTKAFSELPVEAKIAHATALCCLGLAVLLLMAPASLHRIAFNGEDDPQFVAIGSWFVTVAPLPLAFAIALDTYIAAGRALQSQAVAIALAIVAIVVLLGAWYGYPTWRRLSSAESA